MLGLTRGHSARRWNKEEIASLKELYSSTPLDDLVTLFERPATSIKAKANALGLGKDSYWTEKEKGYLRKHFKSVPTEIIAEKMNRTPGSIKTMARKLKLTSPAKRWSKEDVEYLRKWYDYKTAIEIGNDLGRTQRAIRHKLKELGIYKEPKVLKVAEPYGYDYS